jgi:hypothetical protein
VYTGGAAQTGLQSGMTLCVALLLTALVFVWGEIIDGTFAFAGYIRFCHTFYEELMIGVERYPEI